MTTSSDTSDLFFQAFQYVSGDCSAAERDAFEQKLSFDPAACDAVADAVQLMDALQVAAPQAVVRRTGTPTPQAARPLGSAAHRRRAPLAVLATVAAIVLVVGGLGIHSIQSPEQVALRGPASPQARQSGTVLEVWSSLSEPESLRDDHAADDPPALPVVPDWMFEALVAAASRPEAQGLDDSAIDEESL